MPGALRYSLYGQPKAEVRSNPHEKQASNQHSNPHDPDPWEFKVLLGFPMACRHRFKARGARKNKEIRIGNERQYFRTNSSKKKTAMGPQPQSSFRTYRDRWGPRYKDTWMLKAISDEVSDSGLHGQGMNPARTSGGN